MSGDERDEFKNRRKSRSRGGDEADRRRAEAALWRVAKAEVFFALKSASLCRRLPFLNSAWGHEGDEFNGFDHFHNSAPFCIRTSVVLRHSSSGFPHCSGRERERKGSRRPLLTAMRLG